jgi:DNA-binding protein YbaB
MKVKIMAEIEKRSIVLTKELAKKMDKYALQKHISFSSSIRSACELLLTEASSSNSIISVSFNLEETLLLTKVSESSLRSKEEILKDCFTSAIAAVVEKIAKDKEFISQLNKKL